jgi:ribosomal protein S30
MLFPEKKAKENERKKERPKVGQTGKIQAKKKKNYVGIALNEFSFFQLRKKNFFTFPRKVSFTNNNTANASRKEINCWKNMFYS